MTRQYTEAERAEAVALAAAIGPVKAAEKLGLPRRTVSYWLHQPAASPIIAAAEMGIADQLRAVNALALAEVTAGLRDPKARLGDKVAALRVVAEQLALAENRSTSNSNVHYRAFGTDAEPEKSGLTPEEMRDLRDWLDSVEEAGDGALLAAPEIKRLLTDGEVGIIDIAASAAQLWDSESGRGPGQGLVDAIRIELRHREDQVDV